jgi:hypothetical protein
MKEQSRLSRSGGWVGGYIKEKSRGKKEKKTKRQKEKKETKGRALKVTI